MRAGPGGGARGERCVSSTAKPSGRNLRLPEIEGAAEGSWEVFVSGMRPPFGTHITKVWQDLVGVQGEEANNGINLKVCWLLLCK